MSQPSVSDYFNVVKRKTDGHSLKTENAKNDDAPVPPSEEVTEPPECTFEDVAATTTGNCETSISISELPRKLPRLALIASGSTAPISESEAGRLISAGPPRLTPIKNGVPIPTSPVRDCRRPGLLHGGVSSPLRTSTSDVTSPSKASSIGNGSPISRGSPIKPAPEILKKSVVERLFCIGDEVEEASTNMAVNDLPLPAYQKFAHLASRNQEFQGNDLFQEEPSLSPTDMELYASTLPLPYKYNVVQELFRAVETVSSLFYNRREPIKFSKLKVKVSDLLRKPLLRKQHLSQILTILPNSYDLSWVKGELLVKSNISRFSTSHARMDHEVLMARRREFTKNLLGICYQHHLDFLTALVPPIHLPAGKTLTRWHPSFPLDNVPDIDGTVLPSNPDLSPSKSTSRLNSESPEKDEDSRQQKTKIIQSEIAKAKEALMAIRKSKLKLSSISPLDQPKRTITKEKSVAAVQLISNSLLDKIRARERLKAIRSMTLTPEESKDRELLTRLPSYVRIIRNAILIENKSVIPLHVLTRRVMNSQSQLCRENDVEDHFRLLEKIVPDWLRILKGTQGAYVKVDMDIDINGIVDQVEVLIRKSGESLFK